MIMTQDKARKIAIRQRMAATGEPYSVSRHAVDDEDDRLEPGDAIEERAAQASPNSAEPLGETTPTTLSYPSDDDRDAGVPEDTGPSEVRAYEWAAEVRRLAEYARDRAEQARMLAERADESASAAEEAADLTQEAADLTQEWADEKEQDRARRRAAEARRAAELARRRA
jgi:hypothetical protein